MKLKTIITTLLALVALTGLAQKNNYTVSGDLSTLFEGTSYVVKYDSVYILNDSTRIVRQGQKQKKYAVKDGKFKISGYVRQPLYSTLQIDVRMEHDGETEQHGLSRPFILEAGNIVMGFNYVMQGLLTAAGDSRTPFKYNAAGAGLNIVLDPVLIFGPGPFPQLGVIGAAAATVISQSASALLFALFICRDDYLFKGFRLFAMSGHREAIRIIKLGAPPAIFNIVYAVISIVISRIIVTFGDAAVAVQRIGGQIESVTWMTSEGFSYAMNSFTAQNYGAENFDRVKKGFNTGTGIMTVFGALVTLMLVLGAGPLFGIFIHEPDVIAGGANYLRIVGLSQLFMCYEMATTGAFNGIGQTKLPSITGLVLTVARIPMCWLLMPVLGINGVWWAISLSSIIKGVLLQILFRIRLRKLN